MGRCGQLRYRPIAMAPCRGWMAVALRSSAMTESTRRDHWLTAQEAADRLRISRKTLYNWASTWEVERRGPEPLRLGGRALRYRASDVERCVEARQ
ncbi:helix-turn-helix transcriptional regulator [Streptomyces phaeochromogenes]|uniref:helix-turn-helix transcriptional regulator n=1 Tax=Streptomyces phaeochromogenes TaxID=1923 RepID=UPI00398CE143